MTPFIGNTMPTNRTRAIKDIINLEKLEVFFFV
jgi:hypothetical protein